MLGILIGGIDAGRGGIGMDAGNQYAAVRRLLSEDLVEVFIRIGLITLLVFVCIRIFAPFATLMLWGLILAVALYPLCRRIAARLGGRTKLAAAIVVLIALLVIGVPTAVLGSLFAGQIHAGYVVPSRPTSRGRNRSSNSSAAASSRAGRSAAARS